MILYVDDNEIMIDWLRNVIEDAGYYYDAASDATIALYKLERLEYALVLIDIGLPDFPGDVLAERVKELAGDHGATPLVAVTGGEKLPPDRRHLFCDMLMKPFLPDDLKRVIHDFARPPVKDLHLTRPPAGMLPKGA